jgi:uncharacterized membrane protein
MYRPFFLLLIFFSACQLPAEKEAKRNSLKQDTTVFETSDVNAAAVDTFNTVQLPRVQKIKSPDGIYRTLLLSNNKVEQTIAFNSDFPYQLQEKYINDKKDSTVVTEGTWTPSDGFIWLYKDQIVRARYKWKGDTLQYYSPLLKRNFSMNHLQDALQNVAWRSKSKEGVLAFGIGNEPFWTIEYNNKDSLSFLLSEWDHPLKMKMASAFTTSDSVGYIAQNDSTQLRVTIFPHFCSDGMSGFTYRNKIRVQYNQQVYNGCGIVYKQ